MLLTTLVNLELAKLILGEAVFYDLNGDEIEKQTMEIKGDAEAAEKARFEHFMMKEIHEQPKAVQDTLNSVIKDGAVDLSRVENTEDEIRKFEQIYSVACGSAWHVGRGIDYAVCLEGSLKLKEISYIHSETYAAGELKHGTISLIERKSSNMNTGYQKSPHFSGD